MITSGIPVGAQDYKWEKSTDGAAWQVVTGSGNMLIAPAAPRQPGNHYYRVTVETNNTCSPVVTSTPATVTIREAFNPGKFQVTEGGICPGATPAAITGVSAPTGGDGNYTYQWYKDGGTTPVGTAATYQPETFGNATTAVYTRAAKDGCTGSVLTQVGSYTLTVSESGTSTINVVPAVQNACAGKGFTVTSGEPAGALGYTWYRSADGAAWKPVAGTTKSLSQTESAAGQYYYKVEVQTSNTCSPVVISAPATVTIYNALDAGTFLTTEGTTRINERPETISGVSAPKGGSGSYTYRWHKNGQPIANATGALYWPPVSDAEKVGNVLYTREVIDGCGNNTFTAGTYTLKVGANPTTNIIPVSDEVCNNTAFTLTAGVYNGTYTWKESTDGVNWNDDIPGATFTDNTVEVPGKTTGVYYYDVTITNASDTITVAAPATITVREALSAGAFHITVGNACVDETPATIFAGDPTGGSGNYTYQWYWNNAKIAGTEASYQPAANAAGTYYREVTDAACGGTKASGSYELTVDNSTPPTANLNPAVLAVCGGEAIGIAADAYNGGIYVWEESANGKDYTTLSEQTANVLNIPAGRNSGNTYYYKLTVLGASACSNTITSAPATVTIYDTFDAGKFTVSEGGVCTGEQPQAITGVTAPAGGDGHYTYQWKKNGVEITGATAATYQPPVSDALTVGTVKYTREVENTCGTGLKATAGAFTLKVGGAPTTNIVPAQTTACNNDGTRQLTAGTVTGGAYKWERNINGVWTKEAETDATFNVPATADAGDYYYRVTVETNGGANCNVITSVPATVTVREAFTAGTFHITTGNACVDETPATIFAGDPTGGSGTYTYQWYWNNAKIAGTEASYQPAANAAGTYYREVTDAACGNTKASGSYELTVDDSTPPTANLNPAVLAVCGGEAIDIAADAYNGGIYVWEESANGTTYATLSEQTANVLNIPEGRSSGTYYYKLTVLGASACSNTITSVPATVTVRTAFDAGTIPATGSICAGGTPTVTIAGTAATGGDGNYSYRWYKNGTPIPGANAATYTPRPEDAVTKGAVNYAREAKDGACDAWASSGTYVLTVTENLPISVTVTRTPACYGEAFSVAADGGSAWAWEEYLDGEWEDIGESGQTLRLDHGKDVAGNYYYRAKVTITGACATKVYSEAATVTVLEAFKPGDFLVKEGSICPGATPAAITGVSTPTGGGGTYSYAWYKDGNPTAIDGATAATYQPETFSNPSAHTYTRRAYDTYCATTDGELAGSYTLTVTSSSSASSTINLVPAAQEVCNGTTFTVTSGTPAKAKSYEWHSSTDGVDWKLVPGQSSKVLNVSGSTVSGTQYYRVTVQTDNTCSPVVTSTPATVTIGKAFNPGAFQIKEGSICPGATPAVITGVSNASGGKGNYTYQWYEDGTKIDGATAATYQPASTYSNGTKVVFTRAATDGCHPTEARVGSYTLTVSESDTSTINLVPAAREVCDGNNFTVTSGVPDHAQGYTWYSSTDGADWKLENGQTSEVLTVSGAATGTYYYQVVVQTANTCSPVVTSTPATITVNEPFDAGRFLVTEGSVCIGRRPQAITGVSDPTGGSGNYTYQWYKDGDPILGATAKTYQPGTFSEAKTAVYYTRKVIDRCGTAITSGTFTLKVDGTTLPTVDIVPVSTPVCYDTRFELVAGDISTADTWQWEGSSDNGLNWTLLSQNKTLSVDPQTTPGTYYYRVTITTSEASCNVVESTPATVTVRPELQAGEFIVGTGSICVGAIPAAITGNVTDPTGGDGNYTFQWYANGVDIPGATAATYQPETFSSETVVTYTRGVKDGSCNTTSYKIAKGSYVLKVGTDGTQTTNLSPAVQGKCGSEFTITAVAPANALGYTWEESSDGIKWDVLPGQNTNELNHSSAQTLAPGTYYYKVTVLSDGTCAPAVTSTPATVTVYADFEPGTFTATTFTETCMRKLPEDSKLPDVSAPVRGSGNFTYQWYKNDGTTNKEIGGATGSLYRLTPNDVAVEGAYTFTREVTDAACRDSQFSAGSYVLKVNASESVTVKLISSPRICYGGSVTMEAALADPSVTAAGYSWEFSEDGGTTWDIVKDATLPTLTVSTVTITTQYRALIDVQGQSTCQGSSDPVQIVVGNKFTPGAITTAEYTVCPGGTPEEIKSEEDAAGGLGDIIYEWYQDGVGPLPNADKATYLPAPAITGSFSYTRHARNASCNNIGEYSTGTYVLHVIDAPTVTVADANSCAGGAAATLTAEITGVSSATYTWQYYENGVVWKDVADGNPANATYTQSGQTLTVSGLTTAATYNYRVLASTGISGCETLADTAQLTIHSVPVGGKVTVNTATVCATSPATLTLSEHDGTAIEWSRKHNDGDWEVIPNATAEKIQVIPASAGTWYYIAAVSNDGCSPDTSTIGELQVLKAGEGGSIELDGNGTPYLCIGQSRDMKVVGAEGILKWQQRKNGGEFRDIDPSVTSTTYTTGTNLSAGTHQYRVSAVTDKCETPFYSDTLELRVYEKSQGGSVVSQPGGASSLTMCFGGEAKLQVVNYIGESFRWIVQSAPDGDYTVLTGGNADIYTLSNQLPVGGPYNVRAVVSSGCEADTSAAMQVVVKKAAVITLSVDGDSRKELPSFCTGHELVLEITGMTNGSDKWTGTISGGNVPETYNGTGKYWRVNTAAASVGSYTYMVTYTDEYCAPTPSNTITVNYVLAPKAGTVTPPLTEFCAADGTPQPLTLSGNNATIVKWEYKALTTSPGVGNWSEYDVTGASVVTVKPTEIGTYVFRAEVSDSNVGFGACTTTWSNEVQAIRYDVPTISGTDDIYYECKGVDVNQKFTGSAGANFEWTMTVDGGTSTTATQGDISEHLEYSGSGMPQTYTFTVTPVIGTKRQCRGDVPRTITYVLYPEYKVTLDEVNSVTELFCHDAKDGQFVFTTTEATSTFTLKLGNQPVGRMEGAAATFTGLGIGSYTLTAERKAGDNTCTTVGEYVIEGPANPLHIDNIQPTNAVCYGGSTGEITFDVSGGTAPYEASINNGAYKAGTNPFSFTGLAAGVYAVKVRDDKGCVTEVPVTVKQSEHPLTLTATSITPVSAAGANDATATLLAEGGSNSGYRYSATGLDNDFSPSNVVGGLSEGMNYVYAKDGNGCTASLPVEIAKYPDEGSTVTISLTALVTKPLTCDAAADAEIKVAAFGSSGYLYSKNGVSFSGSDLLLGFGAGVHTITVKDHAGRTATIDVTVDPAVPLTFTATITKLLSGPGINDAEVTLNITGDPADYSYSRDNQWQSADNVFDGLSAGTYAFSVRHNKAACEATPIAVSIPVWKPATETPDVGITASITRALTCERDDNAEITVTASGGIGEYSFTKDGTAWTTPSTATVHVFTGLSADTYSLQVRSATDYSKVITLVVEAAAARPVVTAKSTPTTCGNSNGSIVITATGGVGALEYSLSGAQWSYSSTFTNVNAGNYDVLARDRRGCVSNAATVKVDATPPVTVDVTSVTPASAQGAENGQVAVAITGGTPRYDLSLTAGTLSYSGQTSSTAFIFNTVKAGTYTLSVTDAKGCVATKTLLVGAKEQGNETGLSVTYITEDPTCYGKADGRITVTATGGSGTYTYSLDDKTYGDSKLFYGLTAGTYVVYVKDKAEPARKVYVPNIVLKGKEALSLTATIIQNLSAGKSDAAILITAKGGTAPYEYNVNSGGWTNSGRHDGLPAGKYDIQVADANGCSVVGTIVIPPFVPGETVPRPAISASVIKTPDCFGGNNGAIAVTASGGRPPYAYSVDRVNWTSNTTITGLAAGTYTVYVRDSLNRRITTGPAVSLANPDRLTATAVMTAAISVAGASNGAVRIEANGGSTPYQYSIDARNTYQYNNTFTDLQAQLYTFYVKDGKGCEATASILLSEPDKISATAKVTKQLECFGDNDAEIVVAASGGRLPYEYRWDGTQAWSTSATLTGITGGLHNVYVRDDAGSTISVPMFIAQPVKLSVTVHVTKLPTGTNANGEITIVASGGSGSYTYSVVGAGYTGTIPAVNGLGAGEHTVTVTDANGCTASASIRLSTVDVIVNKTVINLNKLHRSEVYTVRLASAPQGNVTVSISGSQDITLTPSALTFAPDDWVEKSATVTIASGVGTPGGISHLTTNIRNTVTNAPDDAAYMGITREVIVNITDDGTLNCTEFEENIPEITLNGERKQSPYAICISGQTEYVLATDVEGAVTYKWMKDGFLEVSTTSSHLLTGSGVYKVTAMNANGCAVSASFAVSMEEAPKTPVILGAQTARAGDDQDYTIEGYTSFLSTTDYKWFLPEGYRLMKGYYTDPKITIRIGEASGMLQVKATNLNSNTCPSSEGRLRIEVKASYGVDVFPTVASNGMPLRIVPKNMSINSIAVVNSVGESYAYKVLSGDFPIYSGKEIQISSDESKNADGEEMQIAVNGLASGHYFIVCYGQDLDGRNVVHTEHIIIKD
jgi:hypothetical protein